MMEPQQQTLEREEEITLVVSGEEATLVAPRFDDEETLVARPVVPLDAEAAEPPSDAPRPFTPRPAYARRPFDARRPGVLALVLVSVLIGGVLGGAGLYIYQRQSQDNSATPQAAAPAEQQQQQQQPAPAAEAPPAPQTEAPAGGAEQAAGPNEPAPEGDAEGARPEPEPEPAAEPAAERQDGAGSTGTRKRGKKGEHDEEIERSAPVRARPDSAGPVARAEAPSAREARRVDSVFYRPRRVARRARRDAGDTDRLRRIFEGAP
ncbi:MAG TPA: hypothetical protein VF659_03900 [Pyrinomonadaceae bacterium]|jgi:hypothetical protein